VDDSWCPAGHKHSDSLENDRPASFKRMLGSTLVRQAPKEVGRRKQQTEEDQGPHEGRNTNHRDRVPHSTQGSVRLEKPCLHYVPRDYDEQRYGFVHMVQRSRRRERKEREEKWSCETNANLHQR
jgi:hypothetical protein